MDRMDRDEILKELTILDFMAVDLALFLNTHEDDREALQEYNNVIKRASVVREAYERVHGPLCSFRSFGGDYWRWPDDPWPWDEEFNFRICNCGEEN